MEKSEFEDVFTYNPKNIRMEGQILQILEFDSNETPGVFEMTLCTNGEMIKVIYRNGKIHVTHNNGLETTIFKHEP